MSASWKAEFYGSQAWKNVREYVYKRDAGLCQDCARLGLVEAAEEVHHIKPLNSHNYQDASISLNPDNCTSLCKKCHARRHSNRAAAARRYTVDEFGHVTIIY